MNKMLRKMTSIIATATLAIASIGGVSVHAGNTGDTDWYSGNGYTRAKLDDTSIYVYNKSSGSAKANIFGVDIYGDTKTVNKYKGYMNIDYTDSIFTVDILMYI
jgi:hypothetical protein